MNWKRLVAMLLTGIFVLSIFYWGAQVDYSSYAIMGEQVVEGIDTENASAVALGASIQETTLLEENAHSTDVPFAAYPFYNAEYLDRYTNYQRTLPELDTQTILWHVNAGLDQAPYVNADETDSAHPFLVNKQHQLPNDYIPAELVEIHSGILATPGTAEAFGRMRTAAMRDGVYIEAAAGYRSIGKQKELFEAEALANGAESAEATVARPGFGEHGTGRALHIVDRDYTLEGFGKTPEYAWLAANCADYGFILRYGEDISDITGFAYEPYHFTFVGADIAHDMQQQSIASLEEYSARGLAPSERSPIDDRITVVIALGYSGDADFTYENDVASRMKAHLERENVRVVVTQDRRDIENESKADALIGLSRQSATKDIVAWFASDKPESRRFAETVCSRLCWSGISAESRGISEDEKAALTRLTEAPAALIEMPGADHTWPGSSEKMANTISDAVIAHLGIRKMYLTFDDGPTMKNTPKVLDILKEKGVKATFFVVGEIAEANPDMLRRIAAEGHTIGIHCYSHDYEELYASVESFTADFHKARETVKNIAGVEPIIYRFPGGSINEFNKEVYEQIIEEMNEQGFIYYDWNISVDDAVKGVQFGDLLGNVKSFSRPRKVVLLMHDAYPYIVEELSEIINYYADYQMAVIEDVTVPIQF